MDYSLDKRFGGLTVPNLSLEVKASEPKAEAVANPLTVESFDNHVYFYSNVNADRCLALIRTIREVDNRLRAEQLTRGISAPTPIWLHIQSPGGGLFAGLGLADQLHGIKSPIYSVIEGYCASAATLISMACTRRFITPSSYMLIHQFFAVHWGTYEEFKDEMKLQDMLMERLVRFYVSLSKSDEDAVREMLKHDTWMDSAEALHRGFVDEIVV